MGRVTVRVPLEASLDLLEAPQRVCLSFVTDHEARVEPFAFRHQAGRYVVGIPHEACRPHDDSEVVLLVDSGVLFFELRAIYVRGTARRLGENSGGGLVWYEVEPEKTTSWNYGRMRVEDEP